MIRIAIPCFGEEVATCFNAARLFQVWNLEEGEVSGYQVLQIEKKGGIERFRLLKRYNVTC